MKPNEVAILKNTITKEQYRNLLSDLQTSDGMDAFWREKVTPLLKAMEQGAMDHVS